MLTNTAGTISINGDPQHCQPQPCRACGACPTCGRGAYGFNPWVYPYTVPPIWYVNPYAQPFYTHDYNTYQLQTATITIS